LEIEFPNQHPLFLATHFLSIDLEPAKKPIIIRYFDPGVETPGYPSYVPMGHFSARVRHRAIGTVGW
jgi:hypothetical protein